MGQTFDVDFDVVDGAGDVAQFEVGRLADGRGGQRLAADHHVVRVGEDLRRVRRARHRFLKKKKRKKNCHVVQSISQTAASILVEKQS